MLHGYFREVSKPLASLHIVAPAKVVLPWHSLVLTALIPRKYFSLGWLPVLNHLLKATGLVVDSQFKLFSD